jgi:hypothetical protein
VAAYRYGDLLSGVSERCFRVHEGVLNVVELRVSRSSIELWASDYDDPANLALRMRTAISLPFERGYVHLVHGQLAAAAEGAPGCSSGDPTQCPGPARTMQWDNVGFDGPALPTPRAYGVPNNDLALAGGVQLGYSLASGDTQSFSLSGVDPTGATGAWISTDLYGFAPGEALEYQLNAAAPRQFSVPALSGGLRGVAIPLELSELVSGDNTLQLRSPTPSRDQSVGNVDLVIDVAP